MAWREELHPRDERGRFTVKGSRPAVSIKATLADLEKASDDDLADVFHRLSIRRGGLPEREIRAIADEMARREDVAKLPEPDPSPRERKVDDLLARGASYEDAFAEAYGVSPERVRRERLSTLLGRRAGESLEQARRRGYRDLVCCEVLQAEEATRGNLVAGRCRGVDPASLWSAAPTRARRCASEELKRWWEDHGGRKNYATWKAGLGTASHQERAAAATAVGAGAGRDFGL